MNLQTSTRAAAIALLSFAGLAFGQAGTPPTYVSGFPHTALGGATFGPVDGRRLPIQNLGSSGEDGVEIQMRTTGELGCDIEMAPVLASPGAQCRVKFKGWDGTIKGHLDVHAGAAGTGSSCDLTCDYGSYSGTYTVTLTTLMLRDNTGALLASVDVPGGLATCGVEFPSAGPIGPPPPVFSVSAHTATWDLKKNVKCRFSSPATVSGVLSTPVSGVSSVEFIRILCITAPCPGDGTNMLSMQVTGSNIPGGELVVGKASFSDLSFVAFPNGNPPKKRLAPLHGTGGAHLEDEACDIAPPGGCTDGDRRLPVRNLGSSGEDGVSIDLLRAVSLDTSGGVHQDLGALSATIECAISPPGSGGGGGGGGGGGAAISMIGKSHELQGNVTLIKLTRQPDPLSPIETVYLDSSGRGSLLTQVRCLDDAGAVLATGTVGPTDPMMMETCSGRAPRVTTNSDGTVTIKSCTSPFFVALPSGTAVGGVSSIQCRPIDPTRAAGVIEEVRVTATLASDVDITEISYEPPEHFGGRPHRAVGAAALAAISDDAVSVTNIGSSGQDGVEVHLDSAGGGCTVDLTPLLGSAPEAREIKIRPKGWDGTIKGHLRLSRAPGTPGDTITETYDLTGTGVTGMTWRLYGAGGVLLRQGHQAGPVLSYTITPQSSSGGSCNKAYRVAPPPPSSAPGGTAALREAQQGFFDIAMTVNGLPPGEPVLGTLSITVTPDPCAGLPENCPPNWSQLSSMVVTGSGIPQMTVSESCLSMEFHPTGSTAPRVRGLEGALVDAVEKRESPTLCCRGTARVTNIGSSGQDGVSIDLGTVRTGTRVAVRSTATGAGGGAGGSATEFRRRCPDCPPGHVTLIKVFDEPDPSGARMLGADSSGRGSTATLAECRSSTGTLQGSAVLSASDRVLLFVSPLDSSEMECRVQGYVVNSHSSPFDCMLPTGVVLAGVSSITLSPISPTVPSSQCDTVHITGTSLDEMVLESLTVTPPCPADINGDGAITPADVGAFVSLWFASLNQGNLAGDFDGNGVVNPADVGAFVTAWFATLSSGSC